MEYFTPKEMMNYLWVYSVLVSNPQPLLFDEIMKELDRKGIFVGGFLSLEIILDDLVNFGLVERQGIKYVAVKRKGLRACLECGIAFIAKSKKQKFCSPTCRAKYHIKNCKKCQAALRERIEVKNKTGKFPLVKTKPRRKRKKESVANGGICGQGLGQHM